MKLSKWLREKIATHGGFVLEGRITEEQAISNVASELLTERKDEARDIIRDILGRHLRTWIRMHERPSTSDAYDSGQLDLFPEIPRKVEVAPGRFVDQAFMTRKDWLAAIRQAETKASNAGGFAEAIKRIADKVLPLLTDDELTTADVWKQPGQAATG